MHASSHPCLMQHTAQWLAVCAADPPLSHTPHTSVGCISCTPPSPPTALMQPAQSVVYPLFSQALSSNPADASRVPAKPTDQTVSDL